MIKTCNPNDYIEDIYYKSKPFNSFDINDIQSFSANNPLALCIDRTFTLSTATEVLTTIQQALNAVDIKDCLVYIFTEETDHPNETLKSIHPLIAFINSLCIHPLALGVGSHPDIKKDTVRLVLMYSRTTNSND